MRLWPLASPPFALAGCLAISALLMAAPSMPSPASLPPPPPASPAASSPYPSIASLSESDPAFRQLQAGIAEFYRASAANAPLPELLFFSYRVRPGDDLFSLAASLFLPYDALATLNRISRAGVLAEGQLLVVPSMPGVFLPADPRSDLEYLMYSWREKSADHAYPAKAIRDGLSSDFAFFPGERFHPAERAYFLNALFRYPLPRFKVTSAFGFRASPLTGEVERHSGIDLAAPAGTDVYAAREGTVVASGWHEVYGNYVMIAHEAGWQTLYGHLSSISARLNQRVESGMIIGKVGSTGRSTGPHLHFEVRSGGEALDPASLLPSKKP